MKHSIYLDQLNKKLIDQLSNLKMDLREITSEKDHLKEALKKIVDIDHVDKFKSEWFIEFIKRITKNKNPMFAEKDDFKKPNENQKVTKLDYGKSKKDEKKDIKNANVTNLNQTPMSTNRITNGFGINELSNNQSLRNHISVSKCKKEKQINGGI